MKKLYPPIFGPTYLVMSGAPPCYCKSAILWRDSKLNMIYRRCLSYYTSDFVGTVIVIIKGWPLAVRKQCTSCLVMEPLACQSVIGKYIRSPSPIAASSASTFAPLKGHCIMPGLFAPILRTALFLQTSPPSLQLPCTTGLPTPCCCIRFKRLQLHHLPAFKLVAPQTGAKQRSVSRQQSRPRQWPLMSPHLAALTALAPTIGVRAASTSPRLRPHICVLGLGATHQNGTSFVGYSFVLLCFTSFCCGPRVQRRTRDGKRGQRQQGVAE